MFKPQSILDLFHAEQLTQRETEILLCGCTAGELVDCPEALAMVRQIDGDKFNRLAGALARLQWDASE